MNISNSKTGGGTTAGKIVKCFPAAFIGGLLTILTQQAFFKPNKKTEARIELQKDFLKENHNLYNKLIFWTDINTQWKSEIAYEDSLTSWKKQGIILYLDTTKPTPSVTTTFRTVLILRLLVDTTLQNLSRQYTKEIDTEKFNLDPNIMQRFIEINDYRKAMQLAKDSTLPHLIESGWADGNSFRKWIKLNIELKSKIDSFTNLE